METEILSRFWLKLQGETINESIEDKGILKAMFLGGNPGAGKSYVLSNLKSGSIEPRIVNTDKHTEFLAYLHGTNVNDILKNWDVSPDYGRKIKKLTINQLALYLNSMLPLFIDGTSTNPNNLFRRIGVLRSIGYDVGMVWVKTSLETSLKRNQQRERNVSEDFLKKTYEKTENLRNYYSNEFKTFIEVKNDEGELTNDVIKKAFNKTTGFFNKPVENPIGVELIKEMRKNNHKYLIDTERYNLLALKKLLNTWYTQ